MPQRSNRPVGANSSPAVSPAQRRRFAAHAQRSHAVITALQDEGGAYPACPTFSAYQGYSWLRDGGFIGEGVSRFGDIASANAFHGWVTRVLAARRHTLDVTLERHRDGEQVPMDHLLPTRYRLDGQNGSTPWWNFQTDGYGTWLWALAAHSARHDLDPGRWLPGVEVALDFIAAFWDRPCYDWWEENPEQRHVSTLAAVHGGLVAAANLPGLDTARAERARQVAERIRALVVAEGVVDDHLTKWLGSTAVDASLCAAIVPFGLVEMSTPVATGTLTEVTQQLCVDGGVHRFSADVFYGGGQWPLLSALLGWNLAATGNTAAATQLLTWVADQADAEGLLPEQVDHHLLHPESRSAWIERWGPVATPLLWSHAMYLILADELGLLRGENP